MNRTSLGAVLLCAALGATAPAAACGPDLPSPAYWFHRSPNDPERFLDGELGVLSQDLREPYLYVAFRHLSGLGVDAAARAAVAELFQPERRDPWSYDALQEWEQAAARVPGRARPAERIRVQALLNAPDEVYASYFVNCAEDAFRTAAETLAARAELYGLDSPRLRAWLAAQDTVFGNCGGEVANIPEPLAEDADDLERADRRYQIAAAQFYARRYDEAVESFRAIAADRESPWSDLAAYLVARTIVRSATVGLEPRAERFALALEALDEALADPGRAPVHRICRGLRQYLEIRLDPEDVRERLRRRLTAPLMEPPLRQDWIDFAWLLHGVDGERLRSVPDLDRWILTFRRRHDGARLAAERLEESELGLAAALVLTEGRTAWIEQLFERAAALPPTSATYPTAAYHLARLRRELGEFALARRELDVAYSVLSERLSLGDRQRFAVLRAELAPTLEERIELGQLRPVAYSGLHTASPDNAIESGPPYLKSFAETTLPADVAVNALNLASTARLVRLLSGDPLEPRLRNRLAPLVWTRAVLLGEEELALRLEPIVAAAAPELARELELYRRAASGDDRAVSAALTILRFPGLRPLLRHGFGRIGVADYWQPERPSRLDAMSYLRDNWWCSDLVHGISRHELQSLDEGNRREAEETIARLGAVPPAPTHLGYLILGWAERRGDDPRVPEALHRVVRATRVCGRGEISRVAFHTLHRRYPGNPWTEKTRYWYE